MLFPPHHHLVNSYYSFYSKLNPTCSGKGGGFPDSLTILYFACFCVTVGLVFDTRPLRVRPVFFKSLLYPKGLAQGLAHSRSSVNSMGRKERKKKWRDGGRKEGCME